MSDASRTTVKYFFLGALSVFAGSVLFCILGFTVVLPFKSTRYWPEVYCTVVNSTYDLDVCLCDETMSVFDTCRSQYPCLKVYVSYNVSTTSTRTRPTTSHDGKLSQTADDELLDLPRRRRRSSASEQSLAVDYVFLPTAHHDPYTVDIKWREQMTAENKDSSDASNNHRLTASSSSDNNQTARTVLDISPNVAQHSALKRHAEGARNKRAAGTPTMLYSRSTTPAINVAQSHTGILYRSWDDSFYPQCSLAECADDSWNTRIARQFKSDWGQIGQTFTCFYNPDRLDVVILECTSLATAVHAVVWPGLLLLAGVGLWVELCLGCWSHTSHVRQTEELTATVMPLPPVSVIF